MTEQDLREQVTQDGMVTMDVTVPSGRQRGFAIASLILGILAVLTFSGGLILGILAISFAIAARDKTDRRITGKAKAGLILGIISIVMLVMGVGAFVGILFAFINALEEGCAAAGDSINQSLADSLRGGVLF